MYFGRFSTGITGASARSARFCQPCGPLAFALLTSCLALQGQVQTGRLTGTVTDESKSVVPNAQVTVTNSANNATDAVRTNGAGDYVFPTLPPSTFSVTVTAPGFRTARREGVELLVGQVANVDVQLQVGNADSTVEVTANAPILETESGSLGQVITTRQVSDLPLNGRNFYQLAGLATGSALLPNTSATSTSIRPNYLSGMTISGVSGTQVGFVTDGLDVTDNLGGTAIQTSLDDIQEFKIQQNAYSAEYSRAALFNLTTRPGTNEFHGSLYEYLRNNDLDARNFFARTRGALERNQFGGALGGPVWIPKLYKGKDRTFFLINHEGIRQRLGETFNDIVPAPAMLQGVFAAAQPTIYDPATTRPNPSGSGAIRDPFPGNVIPSNRLAAQALFFDKYIPAPNLTATTASFVPTQTTVQDQINLRVDQNFSSSEKFFARWSEFKNHVNDPSAYPALGLALLQTASQNVAATLTSTLSPSKINEFRFNYLTATLNNAPFLLGTDFNQQAGITGLEQLLRPGTGGSFPDFAWSGYTSMLGSAFDQRPKTQDRRQFQFIDTLTMVAGKHVIRAGVDMHRLDSRFTDSREYMGNWSFTGLNTQNPAATANTGSPIADWDLGLPFSGQRAYYATTFGGFANYWHFFVQDDFKVTNRLTLNLGMRYEYSPWLRGYDGQLGTFDATSARPIIISSDSNQVNVSAQPAAPIAYAQFGNLIQTSHQAGLPDSITYTDRTQFAPRFGFAYRPFGERTVVRGGYGIFYEPEQSSGRVNLNMVPYLLDETLSNSAGVNPNRTFGNFFLGQQIGSGTVIPTLKPTYTHLKYGYDQHWNFGIQQSLSSNLVLEADYVGDKGTDLATSQNFNLPSAGPGAVQSRRPYPLFGQSTFFAQNAGSIYHALQSKLERRFSSGLWFLASYTFSKNISNAPTPQVGGNYGSERALAAFDITHALGISAGYELPFGKGKRYFPGMNTFGNALFGGWQTQGIVTVRSGRPFTPTISTDVANIGITGQRPNRIGSGVLADPTVNDWFDTSAFAIPASYTYGNSGANILREGWLKQLDVSLFKQFKPREKVAIQFRAEFFNLTNSPSFLAPSGVIGSATAATVTATSNSPRQVQLALRVNF